MAPFDWLNSSTLSALRPILKKSFWIINQRHTCFFSNPSFQFPEMPQRSQEEPKLLNPFKLQISLPHEEQKKNSSDMTQSKAWNHQKGFLRNNKKEKSWIRHHLSFTISVFLFFVGNRTKHLSQHKKLKSNTKINIKKILLPRNLPERTFFFVWQIIIYIFCFYRITKKQEKLYTWLFVISKEYPNESFFLLFYRKKKSLAKIE